MLTLTFLASMAFAPLLDKCGPSVSPVTLSAVIRTESGGDPYVVANVTDGTSHRFKTANDATRFVNTLSQQGKRFSAGLMQIYSGNFSALNLDNNSVFDPCTNIRAGAKILTENYESIKVGEAQDKLKKTLSKYYSGNERVGLKKEPQYGNTSYVERVSSKVQKNYIVPAIAAHGEPKTKAGFINDSTNDVEKQVVTTTNTNKKQSQAWDLFGDF
ncbi:MAG: lytic transglycosylase domain-containing protein [Aeromonas sp.]